MEMKKANIPEVISSTKVDYFGDFGRVRRVLIK